MISKYSENYQKNILEERQKDPKQVYNNPRMTLELLQEVPKRHQISA